MSRAEAGGEAAGGGARAELRALAIELARGAGDLLLGARPGRLGAKSTPTDLVTDADHEAERHIVDRLRAARPDDSILAEEGSLHEGSSGVRWVIDPLDGTVNFVYGLPQWCVSIGIEGAVRAGVIYDPSRGELFTDEGPFRPSQKAELATALVGTGFSYRSLIRERQAGILRRVLPAVRDIRRVGSLALDLAWVASGRLDAFYEHDAHHWDWSAGVAILEGAGGAVRMHGDLVLAAGNPSLLDELERLVLGDEG